MMAYMHSVFVLFIFKWYSESSLNPARRPPLWFPHSHQFYSVSQALWKSNSPILLSLLVLYFCVWVLSCVCLSIHIYAFTSECWVMSSVQEISQESAQHFIMNMSCDISHIFCNCNFNGPFNTDEIYNVPGGGLSD